MNSILPRSIVFLLLSFLTFQTFGNNTASNSAQIPPFLMNNINLVFKLAGKANIRTNVVEFAEKYVGTPYRSGGKKPGGFDCSGFVGYVFSQYGYKLAHSSKALSLVGTTVKAEDARQGDLIFFAVNGRVHHVAMVHSNDNGDLKMIHSCNSKGVYIESVYASQYWKSRLYSIKRII